MIGKDPKYGGYTELFAGLHSSVENGAFGRFSIPCPKRDAKRKKMNGSSLADIVSRLVAPYGRLDKARKDLYDDTLGKKYWEWTEKQVQPYL